MYLNLIFNHLILFKVLNSNLDIVLKMFDLYIKFVFVYLRSKTRMLTLGGRYFN
ncbi:hypothetical protein Hanom_Chr01g00029221 [Helianthus anomalus]